MAIVRDASSPARFSLTTTPANTEAGTSASFTPPASSYIVVSACINSGVGATPTFTVPTWSGSGVGAFSLLRSQTNASGGSVAIWAALTTGTPSSGTITISVTTTGTSAMVLDAAGWVDVWTGMKASQAGAAVTGSTSTTQNFSPTITTTDTGSRVMGVGIDWQARGVPTSTDTIDGYDVSGQTSGGRAFKAADSGAAGSIALNFNAAAASPQWTVALIEILAAPSGGAWRRPNIQGPGKHPGQRRFGPIARGYPSATTDITVALTGQSYTYSAGTLGVAHDQPLTGQAYAWSAGTLAPSTTVALAGSQYAWSTGTMVPSTTLALVGATYTWNTGTLTASTGGDVTVALTGQAYAYSAGTLAVSSTVALVGQAYGYSAGTLAVDHAQPLTGVAEAYSTGILASSTTLSLAGALYLYSTGTLTAQAGGDVTVALTGIQYGWQTGTMTALGGDVTDTNTPGRRHRIHLNPQLRGETEEQKRRRRIEQGIIQVEREEAKILPAPVDTARIHADIERLQREAKEHRRKLVESELREEDELSQRVALQIAIEDIRAAKAALAELTDMEAQAVEAARVESARLQQMSDEFDIAFIATILLHS